MTKLMLVSYIIQWILLFVLTYSLLILFRKFANRELGLQQSGFSYGTLFPLSELRTIQDESIKLENMEYEGTILVFTSATCSVCKSVYPVLQAYQKKHHRIQIISIIEGFEDSKLQHEVENMNPNRLPVVKLTMEEIIKLEVNFFPFSYYLSQEKKILAKGLTSSQMDLELLVGSAYSNMED